ncbi:polyprenyl synthetase family protein [Rhodocista pekingensis]|uniref:Polyprenyl synthetase family protein n=2 Tax=Rhodocista pekingensis TaxID=201185 RepID=A0ABW2KU59_9PROT
MDVMARIELALESAIKGTEVPGTPPRLAEAMRYSVFPGGHRLRPRLCVAVARACGDDAPELTDAAAASIELLHCASLVHDDLPCFDDASIRRSKPSVHKAFGEPLAVLAGDGLIVLAFDLLARAAAQRPDRLIPLMGVVSRSVGVPSGIIAGQAWECEPQADLSEYHRAKTGALFAGATMAGAAAAGADPTPWRFLGERLGEAYQVADDLRDVAADPEEIGKPVGRDAALGRSSAVRELGIAGSLKRLDELAESAIDSIPACPGQAELQALIRMESRRFLPKDLARAAA